MILGICGGSGAGKTTLLQRLAVHFTEMKPAIFSMDNYYLPLAQQQRDDEGEVNFDLPTALDRKRLVDDLRMLASGKAITLHEYLFNTANGTGPLITINPSPLIMVEGLFLFHYKEVAELIDFSIFIEVDPAVQLARRQLRDQTLRGGSKELIQYQWDKHVTPCFEQFLLPYSHLADFTFHNEDNSEQEFDRLITELNQRLSSQDRSEFEKNQQA